VLLVPLLDVGSDLGERELADDPAEVLVLLGQLEHPVPTSTDHC
jgi:hypothetical protein